MSARKPTPADILALIIERAIALRQAGVTKLSLDNFSVSFAPFEPIAPAPTRADREAESVEPQNPLDDPATYGRSGSVPGFQREEDDAS
mgnify:CR=1 FL=1